MRAVDRRARAGALALLALTLLGSSSAAAAVRVLGWSIAPRVASGWSPSTRVLVTVALYALTMGLPPVVALSFVRRFVDDSHPEDTTVRSARRAFGAVGALAAIGVAGFAALLVWVVRGSAVLSRVAPDAGASEQGLGGLAFGLVGMLVLVWLQTFCEEIAFRGYLLPRAMRALGDWPGLAAHGVAWGVWYMPTVLLAVDGTLAPSASIERAVGVSLTCALAGVLLGWLRLASGSVMPPMIANATFTLATGLPYALHGLDGGLRTAAFGPPGWIALGLLILVGLATRWRGAVTKSSAAATEVDRDH